MCKFKVAQIPSSRAGNHSYIKTEQTSMINVWIMHYISSTCMMNLTYVFQKKSFGKIISTHCSSTTLKYCSIGHFFSRWLDVGIDDGRIERVLVTGPRPTMKQHTPEPEGEIFTLYL